jgi:hypothetical protein
MDGMKVLVSFAQDVLKIVAIAKSVLKMAMTK